MRVIGASQVLVHHGEQVPRDDGTGYETLEPGTEYDLAARKAIPPVKP